MGLLSSSGYAAIYVYRASFFPPHLVFRNGFFSLGSNENLIRHLLGEGCGELPLTQDPVKGLHL